MRRGLAVSGSEARQLVQQGKVTVNGAPAGKPGRQVDPGDAIEVVGDRPRFVSRGGDKLAHALEAFGIDPTGLRVIDVGASTGGFTDCVLQGGASSVEAIDVGRAQLHEKLVADPRVVNRERLNVRNVVVDEIGGPARLLVGDLSFISLRTVMERLAALTMLGGDLVLLVKPQFEAHRDEASKGRGVITDPEIHARVLSEVKQSAGDHGLVVAGETTSPITGGEGNVEFLVHLHKPQA